DLRVGIDLLKRAGLLAERDARKSVNREDVSRAYEVSQRFHLSSLVRSLRDDEKVVLSVIGSMSRDGVETSAGGVHSGVLEKMSLGYTRYYEIIKKLDTIRLINLDYRSGRGRTRLITLRFDPETVLAEVG
ncbi:MAG: cell division control protein 6, partial [Methanocalculus sp.]|nr:cell division control protein 6 [Methanocalculus sp.]